MIRPILMVMGVIVVTSTVPPATQKAIQAFLWSYDLLRMLLWALSIGVFWIAIKDDWNKNIDAERFTLRLTSLGLCIFYSLALFFEPTLS